MIRTILCDEDNHFTEVANPEDISELITSPKRLLWLDLEQPTATDFRLIQGEFGLHPLAIEDAMARHQRPKVDQYENFYFVVFYAVEVQQQPQQVAGRDALSVPDRRLETTPIGLSPADAPASGSIPNPLPDSAPPPATAPARTTANPPPALDSGEWTRERIVLREIAMFMGPNYLVTVHQEPIQELPEVIKRWERNVEAIGDGDSQPNNGSPPVPTAAAPPGKNGSNGAVPTAENGISILLYSLLDTLVDSYFPIIDSIVDQIEDLEDQIFSHFTNTAIKTIFALKKDLLALRRVLAPERDVLNVLSRRDVPIFTGQTLVYFQDVYDHIVRITDSIDTYRDLLSSTIDLYLSMQSNRLNITVQTLTSASIILMVLALITGIYGTNFDNIPELHLQYGYFGMLALMGLVAVLLYLFFKRKGWL